MHLRLDNILFKKTIILFWTLWWIIILWTDSISGLAHLSLLKASWAPDKYNFFADILKMYSVGNWVPLFLYIGILIWTSLIVLFFLWASVGLIGKNDIWLSRARIPFILSLLFWFSFLIADQIIMRYDIENIHMIQGGFQFLSYLALYLLPEK